MKPVSEMKMMLIRTQILDPYNTVDSTLDLQALRMGLTHDGCVWLSLLICEMRHQILGCDFLFL